MSPPADLKKPPARDRLRWCDHQPPSLKLPYVVFGRDLDLWSVLNRHRTLRAARRAVRDLGDVVLVKLVAVAPALNHPCGCRWCEDRRRHDHWCEVDGHGKYACTRYRCAKETKQPLCHQCRLKQYRPEAYAQMVRKKA